VEVRSEEKVFQYIESFGDFVDASMFIERHLEEAALDEMYLYNCSINFINGQYRAGS